MEATIQSTNRAINIDINVSINVDALQAIKQHLWFMVKGAWLRVKGAWLMVKGAISLIRLYRQELRLTRTVAVWCNRHNALMNWLMAIQVMAFVFYVFMFA